MNQKYDITEIKNCLPQYHIKNYLGHGNRGRAYSTIDGKVLKLTLAEKEYALAENLYKNDIHLKYYVQIFDCQKSKIDIFDHRYYIILEEMVDTQVQSGNINIFLNAFKKVWYIGIFNEETIKFQSALDVLRDSLYNNDKSLFAKAREQFLNICPNQIEIYDTYFKALKELNDFMIKMQNTNIDYKYSLWIDANEGNFGFNKDGVLKLFDQGFEKISHTE